MPGCLIGKLLPMLHPGAAARRFMRTHRSWDATAARYRKVDEMVLGMPLQQSPRKSSIVMALYKI
jgi:hypothetical protein